jgi:hypothetical protein
MRHACPVHNLTSPTFGDHDDDDDDNDGVLSKKGSVVITALMYGSLSSSSNTGDFTISSEWHYKFINCIIKALHLEIILDGQNVRMHDGNASDL